MQTSLIDEKLSYDENKEGLVTLFMVESMGYYGYYYGPHAMLLIEAYFPNKNRLCKYVADYRPGDVSFPDPSVRCDDITKAKSSASFLDFRRVRRHQYSTWKVPLELASQLYANIAVQVVNQKEVANFSLRGGFWDRKTSNHNCITWTQHELSKIGIRAVCSKSWLRDKFVVSPTNHIGWVDDSQSDSNCVLVANIHP